MRTYGCYMAELVPADGKELQRVDEHSCTGYVPDGKYYDGVDDDLCSGEFRFVCATERTYDIERRDLA